MAGVSELKEAVATMRAFVADARARLLQRCRRARAAGRLHRGRTRGGRGAHAAWPSGWRSPTSGAPRVIAAPPTSSRTRPAPLSGAAMATLETATRLEALPATAEAFRTGQLSETQAEAVASAAAREPERRATTARAHRRHRQATARRVPAGDATRPATNRRAMRRSSASARLRTWTDGEGAFCGAFRTTPDAGAQDASGPRRRDRAGVQGAHGARDAGSHGVPTPWTRWSRSCAPGAPGALEAQDRDPGAGGPCRAAAGPHRRRRGL